MNAFLITLVYRRASAPPLQLENDNFAKKGLRRISGSTIHPFIETGRAGRGTGLDPKAGKTSGAIAQLGERFNGIEEVVGSIPSGSTK
jgi:hypothetical protein